jgi:hypothetical protein
MERLLNDLFDLTVGDPPWSTDSWLVKEPFEPSFDKPLSPLANRLLAYANLLRHISTGLAP